MFEGSVFVSERKIIQEKIILLSVVQSLEKGGRTVRIRDTNRGLQKMGLQQGSIKAITCSFKEPASWVREMFGPDLAIVVKEKGSGFDFGLLYYLVKFCVINRVGIIHAHCETSYLYGGLAGRLTGTPVIGTYHRSDLSYYQPLFKLKLFARLLTGCVAISSQRQGLMVDQLGIKADKIQLIPGGVDFDRFDVRKLPKSRIRQQLGLSERSKVLLALGHLGEIKGHDVLIKALQRVKAQFNNVQLYIGGDGSEADRDRLESLVSELGLTNSVVFLGQVTEPECWLAACDVFVTVPREEGFGLVFAEAGAMKKPVVASRVGGIQDIIDHQKTGFLVAPENEAETALAIIRLLSDPVLAEQFGNDALLRVEQHFSMALLVERYCRLMNFFVPVSAEAH